MPNKVGPFMKKLIETILNDPKLTEFSRNSNVKQLNETVNSLSEGDFNNFIEEFGKVSTKFKDTKRAKELIEFLCKEREGQFMNNLSLKTPLQANCGSSCSYLNSPEKQQSERGTTRWSVSREDRRKILEQMERLREDQKRRKKQDWCRLTRFKSEFDELWEEIEGVGRGKDVLMEGIVKSLKKEESSINGPESKRSRQQTEDSTGINRDRDRDRDRDSATYDHHTTKTAVITPYTAPPHPKTFFTQYPTQDCDDFLIVDFDCIEDLLISLNIDRTIPSIVASSVNFILNCADIVYRSEALFYTDLKDFDQPFFLYYGKDDDLCALKHYDFYNDDLGKYVRNRSYNDKSKKFYRERAYRHRYMSRKPYPFFFNDSTFNRLREEVEILDKNCSQFHFWFTKTIARRGTIFVSSGSLLRSFSLLLVLFRSVNSTSFDIANSIWSHRKFGPEWTLQEILKIHKGKFEYLTMNKSSKLSIEASRLGIKIFDT